MCLAIPGSIEAIDPSGRLATAEVMGVRREVSIDLIADENPQVGDWILIHVGFAMSLISADDAAEQLRLLAALRWEEEAREEAEGYGGAGGGGA